MQCKKIKSNFLGDYELVENLEKTKRTAAEIEVQAEQSKKTEIDINTARELYRPAATRASLMYFILNDLNTINPINECMYILNKCVDHSRLQKGQTVQHLCNKLSADETPGSCISLMPYITDPAPKINLQEVTTPCNPNPCPEEETCWVNRRKCRHPEICSPFVCHKACRMGDISSVLVPRHSYVRIPLYAEGQANVRCFEHQVCVCGQQNFLHRCKTIPCFRRESCVLGQTSVIKEHGSQFKLDCNHCICNEGEVICTKHKCPSSETNVRWRDLPCECSRDYQPRCGHNGKTYPNPCLAER
ncbi:RECK [Mytilus edulis]|uniref:RECK n=1 Tax=Mytilus edulis TaxID=6550 RepID=A0A8S3UKX2_MYTED|nr:RECK [Mytilus edulis]